MKHDREFWVAHVAAWRGSALSLSRYAARHGMSKGTLGWWSAKLKHEGKGELVELPPARAVASDGGRRPIEVVVEGRYLLRLWPGTNGTDIREVVTALEQH